MMKEEEIIKLFGEPGTNQVYITLPYRMQLAWDPLRSISKFQCHSKIKHRLEAIFEQTLKHYGQQTIKELGLDKFGGCLNVRSMRGGSALSVHAWGLAVDIDPVNNQLKWDDTKALLAKPAYDKFWDIVEANKGISLGRQKNYDWMHFQFIPL